MNKIHFIAVKKEVEIYAISHFKAFYGTFDKRLNKCIAKDIKIVYNEENNIIYLESNFKSGKKSGQAYNIDNIIRNLVKEKNTNAIFYDAICSLTKSAIIRNANKNNENYFGYVIDYLKDNYNICKVKSHYISKRILSYFELI